MHKKDPKKSIIVMLLAFCMSITCAHPLAFAEDSHEATYKEEAAPVLDQTEDAGQSGGYEEAQPGPHEAEDVSEGDSSTRPAEKDADATEKAGGADEDAGEAKEDAADEEAAVAENEIEEPETEDAVFDATRKDFLGYDPLYIAKYADPKYVNVDEMDMACFYKLPAAAKGIATYNVRKQSDFDVTEKNYIAGLTYEMPVYNVDKDSKYYVCIPNVNLFNDNFKAYDLTLAYNNDYAELIKGWKYSKGILYIPKSAVDHPKNENTVPGNTLLAVQLNYAIGGDMDFSKSIPVQILTKNEPVNKTVHTSNIFDRDSLTVKTGIKGRKSSDVSVYLNGNLIPISEEVWQYERSSGNIDIQVAPGVISNINIIFQPRTLKEKIRDISTSAVEAVTPQAFAAVSMDEMSFFRTDNGKPIELDIRQGDIFVGWRGHFSGKYIHGNSEAKQKKRLDSPGYKNSVKYLYGGYTTAGGATSSSNKLAAAWAISSYTTAYNMDNGTAQGSLDKDTMVTHKNTLNGATETKTIYEWMLTYRNQLEKSGTEYGAGHSNGLGGTNNFAFTLPKVVKGAETSLVSSGDNEGRGNRSIQILSDEIKAEQGPNSTSVYYDYWIAAGCNHLDMAEDDDLDAKDNDIYVTCLGLGSNYAVLAFVQSNGGSYTQNACGIYKFKLAPSAYVKVKKKAADTNVDFLKEAPNNYTLAGAEYTLYKDSGFSTQASDVYGKPAILTTGPDGSTNTLQMEPGKYYVKETKASKGYKIDEEVSRRVISLTEANTESDPMIINSAEQPAYTNIAIEVEKTSESEGWQRLVGAEYKLSYYDIEPGTDPAGIKATRSWIVKITKKQINQVQNKAALDFAVDALEEGSDTEYIMDGKRILPLGVFSIEEYKAPDGLTLDTALHGGKVYQANNGSKAEAAFYETSGGNLVIDYNEKFSLVHVEDAQSVVLEIEKKDAETAGAAQGTERDNVKGSLAGAVYDVYYDNDDLPKAEYVGSITTDEEGKGSLSKRETGTEGGTKGTELDPGTYFLEEVQASPGYTVDGMYYKDERGVYENGRHIIRARVKEGQTASFSFTVESLEQAHHTIISKTDITTGKELPGAKLQVLDSEGNIVEEWVSTDKPHDIAALHDESQGLKDGKYTLREITAPYGYDVAEDVEFTVSSNVITSKVEMKNKPLEIGTTATDEQNASHHGTFSETEVINDRVELKGLYEGRRYKVAGKVIDKASGLPLKDSEGQEITAESEEFTASGDTAEVELSFTIDSSKFTEDSAVVVFEKLYRTSSVADDEVPVELAKHEDLDDESQTIRYGCIIGTVATDEKDGDHDISAKKKAVLIDNVEYKNLSPKETYYISGAVYDKTTGELTDIKGGTKFTPETANGTTEVEFKFNAEGLEDHSMVVFEYLFSGDKLIAKHDDVDNKDQTVYLKTAKTSPKTGDMSYLILYSIITAIAMSALAVMIYHRNRVR